MNWTDDIIYDYVSGQLSEDVCVHLENDASQSKELRCRIDDFRAIHEALDGERKRVRIMAKRATEALLNRIRGKN